MLCKASSPIQKTLNTKVYEDNTVYPTTGSTRTYTVPSIINAGSYTLTISWNTYMLDWNYRNQMKYDVMVNWIIIEQVQPIWTVNTRSFSNKTTSLTLQEGDIVSVLFRQGSNCYVQPTAFSLTANTVSMAKWIDKNLIPKDAKSLWGKATCISYWRLENGEFWRDYNIEDELPKDVWRVTTATYESSTFDVTSYRGYISIKVGAYTYKIPYNTRT